MMKSNADHAPLRASGAPFAVPFERAVRVPLPNQDNSDEYIRRFEQLRRGDDEIAGYKGANLGELTAGLLPVPQGFVITAAAYRRAMDRPDRRELLALVGDALAAKDPAAVVGCARAIQSSIARTPVPKDLELAIRSAYHKLGDNVTVAVRSSMINEDRAGTSLRNTSETFMNVTGEAALLEKVLACWMNLWSPSMISYRALWTPAGEPTMAIVVQRMMKATKTGVLLTTDPSSTDRSRILIEASVQPGGHDVLPSSPPDRYRVRKADMRLVETELAGEPLAADPRVLTNHQVFALSSIGADVERQYGAPQEVDWVFEQGSFYFLRSRDIVG